MVAFEKAVERVLSHEGKYIWHPRDPGGETHWGISKRSYPEVDIKNLTREGAIAIYKRDFWDACGVGLSDALKYQAFDAAVNHGIGNAIRLMQKAVRAADDGHWGPVSQSHYENMDEHDIAFRFLGYRLKFMARLSTFPLFGAGWSKRIADNMLYAAEDI